MRRAVEIELTDEERTTLVKWSRGGAFRGGLLPGEIVEVILI